MSVLKNICSYILNAIFILGWLGFYLVKVPSVFYSIIPGTIDHGGKPADINFYIFLLWYFCILISYSFLFYHYFKELFIKKVNVRVKSIIIIKCVGWVLLMYLTHFLMMLLSCALHIAHIETAFWYKP